MGGARTYGCAGRSGFTVWDLRKKRECLKDLERCESLGYEGKELAGRGAMR